MAWVEEECNALQRDLDGDPVDISAVGHLIDRLRKMGTLVERQSVEERAEDGVELPIESVPNRTHQID
jgi:hypothetical protein